MDEGLGLNSSDAWIRDSRISRIVVDGYDTSLPREDVEESLKKHFALRGIKLIHVFVPVFDDSHSLCRCTLIYVNGKCEAEVLMLDGSSLEGRILSIAAYPFDDNSLEHVFAQTKATDKYVQRTLEVTGIDTCLSANDTKKILRRVFPGSGCFPSGDGSALLYLCGQDAMDEALKLSGCSVEGLKFAVTNVLPVTMTPVGYSFERERESYKKKLAIVEYSETNQKIKTMD